ncbi:ABC transporter permease [Glycomyces dulcitolivorans]|jgi:peptide/nickel transport system permease protein|uniref:ABC transporter permease n=1 Tax=Glycomyces dulcitolivorans TaxID=2200759 RepID=UPI000DD397C1|nr:ABC transporter permease [Glycomyces dulcitolivorans]
MTLLRHILSKLGWYAAAFAAALALNFFLPRLLPGNPVDTLIGQALRGHASSDTKQRVYETYVREFGLDQNLWSQFLTYIGKTLQGDFGTSFSRYPSDVATMIGDALPWTIALQLPAVLLGWLIGNLVGAVAAYRRGGFDRGVYLSSLFLTAAPYYCLAVLLLYGLAVALPLFPTGGGWSFGNHPEWTAVFAVDAVSHWFLPFLSLLLVFIGGQAIGMRSMAVYEVDADYVRFAESFGLADRKIIGYIFRNGMLPQITGLALAIGTLVGGALLTEIVFSYPGIGTLLYDAILNKDYPVIQAVTLLVLIVVLVANFLVDVLYGLIDPRIRAAERGER